MRLGTHGLPYGYNGERGPALAELDLTLRQQAILLTLLAGARAMTNSELKEMGRVEIERRDREFLVHHQLIDFKQLRAYHYWLTKTGSRWIDNSFALGPPPARAGAVGGSLFVIWRALRQNLERSLRQSSASSFLNPTSEQQVRDVYAWYVGQTGRTVSLRHIRESLPEIGREDLDKVLDEMSLLPDVSLLPEPNRKALSEADREAAVMIGGQDRHGIAIEPVAGPE